MTEFNESDQRNNLERSNSLTEAVRSVALLNKQKALESRELPLFMQSTSQIRLVRDQNCFAWIYPLLEPEETYTPDDFFQEEDSLQRKEKFDKEDAIARVMYSHLKDIPDEERKVKVILKKIRNKEDNGLVSWRIMGKFPVGSRIDDPDWDSDVVGEGNNEGIIYMETHQACSAHACDETFKKWKAMGNQKGNKQEGYVSFGYVDYSDLREIKERLEKKSGRQMSGFVEFMDPDTRETLDPEDTVTATLAGLYSNEQDRYRIPTTLLTN